MYTPLQVDRSDYSAPGSNPDVPNDTSKEDFAPGKEAKEDVKKRSKTGKGVVS